MAGPEPHLVYLLTVQQLSAEPPRAQKAWPRPANSHPSSTFVHRHVCGLINPCFPAQFKVLSVACGKKAGYGIKREILLTLSVRAQSCPTLWPHGLHLPGSSVHGILQARTLEWVAISFSWESSPPRNQSCISCIGSWVLYHWATWEALKRETHEQLMLAVSLESAALVLQTLVVLTGVKLMIKCAEKSLWAYGLCNLFDGQNR